MGSSFATSVAVPLLQQSADEFFPMESSFAETVASNGEVTRHSSTSGHILSQVRMDFTRDGAIEVWTKFRATL